MFQTHQLSVLTEWDGTALSVLWKVCGLGDRGTTVRLPATLRHSLPTTPWGPARNFCEFFFLRIRRPGPLANHSIQSSAKRLRKSWAKSTFQLTSFVQRCLQHRVPIITMDLPSAHNLIARNSVYLLDKNFHRHKITATKWKEADILTFCFFTVYLNIILQAKVKLMKFRRCYLPLSPWHSHWKSRTHGWGLYIKHPLNDSQKTP